MVNKGNITSYTTILKFKIKKNNIDGHENLLKTSIIKMIRHKVLGPAFGTFDFAACLFLQGL